MQSIAAKKLKHIVILLIWDSCKSLIIIFTLIDVNESSGRGILNEEFRSRNSTQVSTVLFLSMNLNILQKCYNFSAFHNYWIANQLFRCDGIINGPFEWNFKSTFVHMNIPYSNTYCLRQAHVSSSLVNSFNFPGFHLVIIFRFLFIIFMWNRFRSFPCQKFELPHGIPFLAGLVNQVYKYGWYL